MSLPKISIRTNISTYILLIVTTVVLVLSGLQYYFSLKLANEATENTFDQIGEKITLDMLSRDRLAKEVLYQMQNYPPLLNPIDGGLKSDLLKRYVYTLMRYETMYAIYSGKGDGNFFEVINMRSSKMLQQHFKAPDGTRWIVLTVHGEGTDRQKCIYYLDNSLSLLKKRVEATDYRANTRPWYHDAMGQQMVVRTPPYTFASLQRKGITYSKRVNKSSTVLALDFTLVQVERLLDDLMFSESSVITMFTGDGKIVASSSMTLTDDMYVDEHLLSYPLDKVQVVDHEGKLRYMMVSVMSHGSLQNTYLSISVEQSEMLAPYLQNIAYGLLAALLLFIVSLPLVGLATAQIVKPINALMRENKKIGQRKFEDIKEVDTNIIELSRLSHSFVEMANSIQLYQRAQKELMDAFIKLIAEAIDAKSPYTGGHCKRVPVIATMLVKEASRSEEGTLGGFHFETQEQLDEFERGAWLHDCGKITTPEYVVDKATKLETIYNRIHEVRTRFEVIWRDIEIVYLEGLIKGESAERLKRWRELEQETLMEEFNFIAATNIGGEFMSKERIARVKKIAQRSWLRHFDDRLGLSESELLNYPESASAEFPVRESLLSDRAEHIIPRNGFDQEGYVKDGFKLKVPEHLYNRGEIYNLCIERGTLTEEERFKIQEHVIMTIKMLEKLPYTDEMQRIPEYAGTHHETLIGTGYPRELHDNELSIPAKVMAIADIYEALTASDRPYKKGKTLTQALQIMSFMVKDKHLDKELFALFLRSGVYLEYARVHLHAEQIDGVNIEDYLSD